METGGLEALASGGGAAAVLAGVLIYLVRTFLPQMRADAEVARAAFLVALREERQSYAETLREERSRFLDAEREERVLLAQMVAALQTLAGRVDVLTVRMDGLWDARPLPPSASHATPEMGEP